MIVINPQLRLHDDDVTLTATRSRGPGGQNVNKVNSAAVLSLNLGETSRMDPAIRDVLRHRLATRLTRDGRLLLRSDASRDWPENRRLVTERLVALLRAVLAPRKRRKPTRPTAGSRVRRRGDKVHRSRRKQDRRGDPSLGN